MRYAFVSDVHGNLEALSAVLAQLQTQHIEQLIFLGDAVGYGPNPNEVCDLLRQQTAAAVLGNHDAAVSGRMDYSGYYPAARLSLDWCRAQLSPTNMAWLRALPYTVAHDDLLFCHAAPLAPAAFQYLCTVAEVEAYALQTGQFTHLAGITFMGHSHLALAFRLSAQHVAHCLPPSFACPATAKFIITVGSVGQPRDHDPRACYGIFDSTTRCFDYQRVAYDFHLTQQKIHQAKLPSLFAERLTHGI